MSRNTRSHPCASALRRHGSRAVPVAALLLLLFVPVLAGATPVVIREHGSQVRLENEWVAVDYDLEHGVYEATDKTDGSTVLSGAVVELDGFRSDLPGTRHHWTSRTVRTGLGRGRALLITAESPEQPPLLLDIALYPDSDLITLRAGIRNDTETPIQLRRIAPLAEGIAFPGADLSDRFSVLDGNGGGEETAVTHEHSRLSRNNLLATFGGPGNNRSLVLGGLTYKDYEKFAGVGQQRRRRLALDDACVAHGSRLVAYVNLPQASESRGTGPTLNVMQGNAYAFPQWASGSAPEFSTVVFDNDQVVIAAAGLDASKEYTVGLSWWDVDNSARIQSINVDAGPGSKATEIVTRRTLPKSKEVGQPPEVVEFPLPASLTAGGAARIIVRNDSTINAVVSEVWLVEGGARPAGPVWTAVAPAPVQDLTVELYALDPVGKRVDPGKVYLPDDWFCVSAITRNPFEALEAYGLSVRAAQKIELSVYDFPTVCLWYAEIGAYGDGPSINSSSGAVDEMRRIADSGFLNYSRAAVRLVPDLYDAENQQGWWDDEHWRRGGGPGKATRNGRYDPPFETTKQWGRAVTDLGGIPLTYFQTGFRSEDYAALYAEHMLFNDSMAPRRDAAGKPRPYSADMNAWQRNDALWGYDYTDPSFLRHMRQVYANLKRGRVKGLMFDYASSGWAYQGGMEDPYSTTAAAYRTIFRLPHDLLGPESYVHERNLARGSDITLGLVASHRIWGDTDQITPAMVTRGGLRWYKNRVVVNYDMDSKSVHKAQPATRDGVRALLTMAYVTSGRLLLGNSFAKLTPESFYDLTRIYPFHATARSARPVDAFTSDCPTIYDVAVSDDWHQLTLYNQTAETTEIGVALAGDTAFGALGLHADASYMAYDFWNDRLTGVYGGGERLTQELRPHEARMISVRRRLDRPQVLGTTRHLMQGHVDLANVTWDSDRSRLSGTARVAANDPFEIIVAPHGMQPQDATSTTKGTIAELRQGTSPETIRIRLERDRTGPVSWAVQFRAGQP